MIVVDANIGDAALGSPFGASHFILRNVLTAEIKQGQVRLYCWNIKMFSSARLCLEVKTMSQFSLRLPDSLMDEAKRLADDDNVSLNQFFLSAISEKLGELKTRKFFQERSKGADIDKALTILDTLPADEKPLEGNKIS